MTKKKRVDFKALVAPKEVVKKRNLMKSDLYRMRVSLGQDIMMGITDTETVVLRATYSTTWRRLTSLQPLMVDFQEERINPTRTKIEWFEIVDEDTPLFA